MKRLMISLLFILFYSFVTVAQSPTDSVESTYRRWSVSVNLAARISNYNSKMEEEMTAQGFGDDSSPTWFGDGKEYPYSRSYPGIILNAKYYFWGPLAVGLSTGYTLLGEVHGNNDGSRLTLTSSVISLAPEVSVNMYDMLKLGVGPALYFTNTYSGENYNAERQSYRRTKLGVLIDFGLRMPKSKRFFFEFSVQVRLAGQAEVGPYITGDTQEETFQKISINYNFGVVGAGFGIRL
jgi:hypothetical protein